MRQTPDQFELIPPYCPNPHCKFHLGTEVRFYVKNGWTQTDKPPFRNQRYRCKSCGQQFSRNTFDLDFRRQIVSISEDVLNFSMNGMSNNAIARLKKVNEGTVRNRLRVMAKIALIFEKENYPTELNEDVAYDGFETFTHSQHSPCYINTAVGRSSTFIYHNTFSPLNRKGRMTEEQRVKNQELLKKFGPYPSNSVFEESLYIMRSLSSLGSGYKLYSDEHKSYARAHRSFASNLKHATISSRLRRDPLNPLFAINHLHMLYRHCFSSQQRETISFQKHEAALMEKVQLMKIYRNFMNPKFVKKCKGDSRAHEWSPAMYVGVAKKVLSFEDVFGIRKVESQVKLDERERAFMRRVYPFSRQKIAA
jgi:transposase-like protein